MSNTRLQAEGPKTRLQIAYATCALVVYNVVTYNNSSGFMSAFLKNRLPYLLEGTKTIVPFMVSSGRWLFFNSAPTDVVRRVTQGHLEKLSSNARSIHHVLETLCGGLDRLEKKMDTNSSQVKYTFANWQRQGWSVTTVHVHARTECVFRHVCIFFPIFRACEPP